MQQEVNYLSGKEKRTQVINGEPLTYKQQAGLVIRLSIPAILAEISSIVMQYIQYDMDGRRILYQCGYGFFCTDRTVYRGKR